VNANDDQLIGYDLLIVDGLISQIGQNLPTPPGFNGRVIAGNGRYVTPGLVDMHSHVAVSTFPDSFGLQDTNEMTDPTTSYVRYDFKALSFFFWLFLFSFSFFLLLDLFLFSLLFFFLPFSLFPHA
jgi:hypothetical protein